MCSSYAYLLALLAHGVCARLTYISRRSPFNQHTAPIYNAEDKVVAHIVTTRMLMPACVCIPVAIDSGRVIAIQVVVGRADYNALTEDEKLGLSLILMTNTDSSQSLVDKLLCDVGRRGNKGWSQGIGCDTLIDMGTETTQRFVGIKETMGQAERAVSTRENIKQPISEVRCGAFDRCIVSRRKRPCS